MNPNLSNKVKLYRLSLELVQLQDKFGLDFVLDRFETADKMTKCYQKIKQLTNVKGYKYAYPGIVVTAGLLLRLQEVVKIQLLFDLNAHPVDDTGWGGENVYTLVLETKRSLPDKTLAKCWAFINGAIAMYETNRNYLS